MNYFEYVAGCQILLIIVNQILGILTSVIEILKWRFKQKSLMIGDSETDANAAKDQLLYL